MRLTDRDVLIDPCYGITNPQDNGDFPRVQIRTTLSVLVIGLIAFIIGLRPDLFGLDRGLYIGFTQIVMILFGIGVMIVAAINAMKALWGCGPKTLLVDIGTRTIATGYVICAFTALADAFGFGTNPPPEVLLGTLQSRGVIIGLIIICIGLLMMVRWHVPESYQANPESNR